jgi:hypothetical protein
MTRRTLTVVPDRHPATDAPAESFGIPSGVFPLSGRRVDPHAVRRTCPALWSQFLRAHHRDAAEVAYFYGVTDRAARDWWEGVSGPRGSVMMVAAILHPVGFARMTDGLQARAA